MILLTVYILVLIVLWLLGLIFESITFRILSIFWPIVALFMLWWYVEYLISPKYGSKK